MRTLGPMQAEVIKIIKEKNGYHYGVSILPILNDRISRECTLPELYRLLARLSSLGYIASGWSLPMSLTGGRRRRMYSITSLGVAMLEMYDRTKNMETV